jgi:hypothetical protein
MYTSQKFCPKSTAFANHNACEFSDVVVRDGDWTLKAGNIVGSFGKIDKKMMPCRGTAATFSDIGRQFIDHILSEEDLDIPTQTEFIQDVELVRGMVCLTN